MQSVGLDHPPPLKAIMIQQIKAQQQQQQQQINKVSKMSKALRYREGKKHFGIDGKNRGIKREREREREKERGSARERQFRELCK